mmetsp:Transcript_35871/g.57195  ORF Transcript_35871/g.57195 Transcript_35871/m.57195 type:complete len:217 (+) Transcript_35871:3194-3844(+)
MVGLFASISLVQFCWFWFSFGTFSINMLIAPFIFGWLQFAFVLSEGCGLLTGIGALVSCCCRPRRGACMLLTNPSDCSCLNRVIMAFLVRFPLKHSAILAHWLPTVLYCSISFWSSSDDHSRFLARMILRNLVFTACSVRPGSKRAICAQQFPFVFWVCISRRSSSAVHTPFLIAGSKLEHQRSRHCLTLRPTIFSAIKTQSIRLIGGIPSVFSPS